MSFYGDESLIFIIYLKFQVQRYIICQAFFIGKCLNSRIKIQKRRTHTKRRNIEYHKKEIHHNFQVKPFMVPNKTQIASNAHRYKKIVNKILT